MDELEKVGDLISRIDLTNIKDVIILAIILCLIYAQVFKVFYDTYFEEFFIISSKKSRNNFYKILLYFAVLLLVNIILTVDLSCYVLAFPISIVAIIVHFIYGRKIAMIQKYSEKTTDLITYYKRKQSDAFLYFIFSGAPACSRLLNDSLDNSMPLINCTIIISIMETFVLLVSISNLIKHESVIYFIKGNEKMYIYERVDSETVICGDSSRTSEAGKYITISYGELKKLEIFHEKYTEISRERKKFLYNEYRKNKKILKKSIKKGIKSEKTENLIDKENK